eukprot:s466_g21.t1
MAVYLASWNLRSRMRQPLQSCPLTTSTKSELVMGLCRCDLPTPRGNIRTIKLLLLMTFQCMQYFNASNA